MQTSSTHDYRPLGSGPKENGGADHIPPAIQPFNYHARDRWCDNIKACAHIWRIYVFDVLLSPCSFSKCLSCYCGCCCPGQTACMLLSLWRVSTSFSCCCCCCCCPGQTACAVYHHRCALLCDAGLPPPLPGRSSQAPRPLPTKTIKKNYS